MQQRHNYLPDVSPGDGMREGIVSSFGNSVSLVSA